MEAEISSNTCTAEGGDGPMFTLQEDIMNIHPDPVPEVKEKMESSEDTSPVTTPVCVPGDEGLTKRESTEIEEARPAVKSHDEMETMETKMDVGAVVQTSGSSSGEGSSENSRGSTPCVTESMMAEEARLQQEREEESTRDNKHRVSV